MNEKSRVILYASLRKKISNMDVYSFSETPTVSKNLPKSAPRMSHLSTDTPIPKGLPEKPAPEEPRNPGIRKNTLSLSIDELIKENDTYDSKNQEKATKKEFLKKQKSGKPQRKDIINRIIWVSIALIVICLLALIIVVLVRGNK